MNEFEVPAQEPETIDTQIENIQEPENSRSLEKTQEVIDNLAAKFPRLKSLIGALVLTAASLSSPESVAAKHNVGDQTTTTYRLKSTEKALKKVTDNGFRAVFKGHMGRASRVGVDIPKDSAYSILSRTTQIDKGQSQYLRQKGRLPNSAENIIINAESVLCEVSTIDSKDRQRPHHNAIAHNTSFYMSAIDRDAVTAGRTFEVQGWGATREHALQYALEEVAGRLQMEDDITELQKGEDVPPSLKLTERMYEKASVHSDVHRPYSEYLLLSSVFEHKTKHTIKSYTVKNVEKTERTPRRAGRWGIAEQFIVTVEVVEGTIEKERNE